MPSKRSTRIGCLGWGSLIWDPCELSIRKPWFTDGPLLPIEFARFSSESRVTLVIVEGKPEIRSLWALLVTDDLNNAVAQLAHREGVIRNAKRDIGRWSVGDPSEGGIIQAVSKWAIERDLDAVVWTALAYRIKREKDQIPSLDQVIARLCDAESKQLKRPREYVERAPQQIDTDYRRAINKAFSWSCISEI
jgi:hypothetical protein